MSNKNPDDLTSFGDELASQNLDVHRATLSDAAVFGTGSSDETKIKRRLGIIQTYKNLVDTKAIQNLDFTTKDAYSRWFVKNVTNVLNTSEYDGQNKDIKPLYEELKKQYTQVLTDKKLSGTRNGGSHRKQSKRRLRKTQQRRKRNNRKSKKSKQV
jgi:hypothetical protein